MPTEYQYKRLYQIGQLATFNFSLIYRNGLYHPKKYLKSISLLFLTFVKACYKKVFM
jgi:hypothetical protein